jgi:uncharacterized protein
MTDPPDRYRAFPADGFHTRWTTWDGKHTEHLTIRWENEAWTVTGRVEREQIEYVIRLSPLWQTRQFLLFRDLPQPDLWLGTDGHGRWGEMNGAHRPELDGAHEIALAVTPFTHSLPIRRLPLHVGDAFELSVLAIDVETLAVVPTTVRYHRTAAREWRITRGTETLETTVDEFGLVTDVVGAFRRV